MTKDTIIKKIEDLTDQIIKDKCWEVIMKYQWNFNTPQICNEINEKINLIINNK